MWDEKRLLRISRNYLYTALFFALFGGIYERFSHEVYSYYMLYAFLVPLTLGTLPSLLAVLNGRRAPSRGTAQLYAGGVLMLTMASVIRGVLEIYGTTNGKWAILPAAGLMMLAASPFAGAGETSIEARRLSQ